MRSSALLFAVVALVVTAGSASALMIDNAEVESTTLEDGLGDWIDSWSANATEPVWLGWQVPMVERRQTLCCGGHEGRRSRTRICHLEGPRRGLVITSGSDLQEMETDDLVVLVRAAAGKLTEMRAYSEGCHLDAGGRRLIWLDGVDPEESVGYLASLADQVSALADEALMALAMHATESAAERLVELSRQSDKSQVRGEALFWLAQSGAPQASMVIRSAVAEDPDEEVREEAIFALGQLPEGEGLPVLLELLRDGSQPAEIRQQALFWYVQSGDDQALDLIAEILGG